MGGARETNPSCSLSAPNRNTRDCDRGGLFPARPPPPPPPWRSSYAPEGSPAAAAPTTSALEESAEDGELSCTPTHLPHYSPPDAWDLAAKRQPPPRGVDAVKPRCRGGDSFAGLKLIGRCRRPGWVSAAAGPRPRPPHPRPAVVPAAPHGAVAQWTGGTHLPVEETEGGRRRRAAERGDHGKRRSSRAAPAPPPTPSCLSLEAGPAVSLRRDRRNQSGKSRNGSKASQRTPASRQLRLLGCVSTRSQGGAKKRKIVPS